jgi:hypothetical protein
MTIADFTKAAYWALISRSSIEFTCVVYKFVAFRCVSVRHYKIEVTEMSRAISMYEMDQKASNFGTKT